MANHYFGWAMMLMTVLAFGCGQESDFELPQKPYDGQVTAKDSAGVWAVNRVQLMESTDIRIFYKYLEANWIEPREKGADLGLVVSYRVIPVEKDSTNWEFILVTEFENEAKYEEFKDKFWAISQNGIDKKENTSSKNKNSLYELAFTIYFELMSSKSYQEMLKLAAIGGV